MLLVSNRCGDIVDEGYDEWIDLKLEDWVNSFFFCEEYFVYMRFYNV